MAVLQFSMREAILLFMLFNWLNLSRGQDQEQLIRDIACANKTDASLNLTTRALISALSYNTKELADYVYIVDISGSIDPEVLDQMQKFMIYMTDFASIRFEKYIHPELNRVEIITFDEGAQTQIKNLTERHIHACEFVDIVKSISKPADDRMTYISSALDKAFELFHRSDKEVKHHIVIVLTDGEFNDQPSQVRFSAERLKSGGATIFSVGLGYYLDTIEKAERLRMLATEDVHYACYDDWLRMLPKLGSFGNDGEIWAEATADQQHECYPQCSGLGEVCGCNVVRPEYDCVCGKGHYRDGSKCVTCQPGDTKDKVGNAPVCQRNSNRTVVVYSNGSLAGIVIGVILLLLLLLALLFLLLCCLRSRGRGNPRVNACLDGLYERLRGSRRDHPYAVPAMVIGSPVVKKDKRPKLPPPRQQGNSYTPEPRASPRPVDGVDDDDDREDYVNVSPDALTLPRDATEVHRAKSSLFDLLAIYDVEGETVQTSNKSRITRPEMTILLRALRNGRQGEQFKLQSRLYTVKNADPNSYMQGEEVTPRRDQTDVKSTHESAVMWASNATDYVVMGVSKKMYSDNCRTTVFDMGAKLKAAKHSVKRK